MSSSAKSDLLIAKSSLKADVIVLVGITWATVAMVYFLLYSTNPPDWYSPVTYIFECSAYLGASLLCLRNWQSPQIVSGRNVLIGLGMLSYFIGDVLFGLWELVWQQDPAVSPGDIVPGYLYLSILEHDPGSDESANKPGNDSVADNRGSRGGGDRHSRLAVFKRPSNSGGKYMDKINFTHSLALVSISGACRPWLCAIIFV